MLRFFIDIPFISAKASARYLPNEFDGRFLAHKGFALTNWELKGSLREYFFVT